MDKTKTLKFLVDKININEDIIYDKLTKINEITYILLQQKHNEWNEYNFTHLFNHIKHINKKIAYIKQIYDVLNAINEGKLE